MSLLALLAFAPPLADLRVGQDEASARIEIVCAAPCTGQIGSGDAVLISGVEDALSVPVEGGPLTGVRLVPAGAATRLEWTARRPAEAALAPCGPEAVCLDLDFEATAGDAPSDPAVGAAEVPGGVVASCAADEAALDADAWDLDAFRGLALCRAAAGRLEEAVGMLDRLLRVREDPIAAAERARLAARLADARGGG